MLKFGVGGLPFTERNFHPHTTRRFDRRTKDSIMYAYNDTNRMSDLHALLAKFDEFPPGCDADFDADLGELERQLAELRTTISE